MPRCSQHLEVEATAACRWCDRPLCEECRETLDGRPYCRACVEELVRKLAARAAVVETTPAPPEAVAPVAWGRAALFGTGAGLVGVGAWYLSVVLTNYNTGLEAIGVGWLVGLATAKGARGRGGASLGVLSVGIALAAMLLGENLIIHHPVLAEVARSHPEIQLRSLVPLRLFAEVYGSPFGFLDIVFYAIGAYEALKIPVALARR